MLPAATRAGDAYRDPEVRAKGQVLMARASESAKGIVDEFVVGYAEGKASEIRRALEEEAERHQKEAAAAAKQAAAQSAADDGAKS